MIQSNGVQFCTAIVVLVQQTQISRQEHNDEKEDDEYNDEKCEEDDGEDETGGSLGGEGRKFG